MNPETASEEKKRERIIEWLVLEIQEIQGEGLSYRRSEAKRELVDQLNIAGDSADSILDVVEERLGMGINSREENS